MASRVSVRSTSVDSTIEDSLKLVGPRQWVGTRYYIGRVPQSGDVTLYTSQRRFLAKLESESRISTHLGRLEPRPVTNPTSRNLRSYLSNLRTKIDFRVFQDLMVLARRQQKTTVLVEKAVDVMLAVDLVVMAERDDFDDAYLLSADGDFAGLDHLDQQLPPRPVVAGVALAHREGGRSTSPPSCSGVSRSGGIGLSAVPA